MSAKWSAFPSAANVANADILAMVQGGVNKQMGRVLFLTHNAGEAIGFTGPSAFMGFDGAGNASVLLNGAATFTLWNGSVGYLQVTSAGGVDIEQNTGQEISIGLGSASIVLDDASQTISITVGAPVSGAFSAPYTPATPADWAGDPLTIHEAIDRIASVVSVGGTSPIP